MACITHSRGMRLLSKNHGQAVVGLLDMRRVAGLRFTKVATLRALKAEYEHGRLYVNAASFAHSTHRSPALTLEAVLEFDGMYIMVSLLILVGLCCADTVTIATTLRDQLMVWANMPGQVTSTVLSHSNAPLTLYTSMCFGFNIWPLVRSQIPHWSLLLSRFHTSAF